MTNPYEIRIAMVGSGGSGKSEILRRLQGQVFSPLYLPSNDTTEWVIDLDEYRFMVTEYRGTTFYKAEDFADVTAVIVVIDGGSSLSRRYARTLEKLLPHSIPMARMVNKSDISSLPITPESCSAKKKANLETAFLSIAQTYA